MGWKVEFDVVEIPNAKITANSGKVTIIVGDKKYEHTFDGFKTVEIPGTWTQARVIYETDYPVSVFKIEGAMKKETLKNLLIGLAIAGAIGGAVLYLTKR